MNCHFNGGPWHNDIRFIDAGEEWVRVQEKPKPLRIGRTPTAPLPPDEGVRTGSYRRVDDRHFEWKGWE